MRLELNLSVKLSNKLLLWGPEPTFFLMNSRSFGKPASPTEPHSSSLNLDKLVLQNKLKNYSTEAVWSVVSIVVLFSLSSVLTPV